MCVLVCVTESVRMCQTVVCVSCDVVSQCMLVTIAVYGVCVSVPGPYAAAMPVCVCMHARLTQCVVLFRRLATMSKKKRNLNNK